jgi:hypothetical protein
VFLAKAERGEHGRAWQEWSAREFEVGGDGPIAARVDGKAIKFEPPLRFRIRPGVLRARIAAGKDLKQA